jgi:carbamate kinase
MSDAPGVPPLLVVALGGNTIQKPSDDDSVTADFERTSETAKRLASLVSTGRYRLVVTHGNGPQVGNHLLRSQLGFEQGGLPLLPLDVCVADTMGGMGYMIQQCLGNALHDAGVPAVVATLVTQVVVDASDPAFQNPSKPIGEMVAEKTVGELERRGWRLAKDAHRHGWRRVVASPDPREIVEAEAIRALVDDGAVVIAAGGGGIPVIQGPNGSLTGVAAVVDKDLASALLAIDLGAHAFVILTDVDHVFVGLDTPHERPIESMTVEEARAYLKAGEFPSGSMGPKVEAVCRFVESAGGLGLITSVEHGEAALQGSGGTRIFR